MEGWLLTVTFPFLTNMTTNAACWVTLRVALAQAVERWTWNLVARFNSPLLLQLVWLCRPHPHRFDHGQNKCTCGCPERAEKLQKITLNPKLSPLPIIRGVSMQVCPRSDVLHLRR